MPMLEPRQDAYDFKAEIIRLLDKVDDERLIHRIWRLLDRAYDAK